MQGLLGRHTLDKVYGGDLVATAAGEMLSAGGSVPTSAGYVAIERVEGELAGRKGSFYLQHTGVMDRGAGTLTITVIPDTGTADLEGLAGDMKIIIAPGGAHSYEFTWDIVKR
jgi:putative intracellular protease/amidase